MVSANNLNLDVLELIFAHLYGDDLVSVAHVSKSFYAGVVPYLYRSLHFRLNQAKRYPNLVTPFAVVRSKPDLAVHVQRIEVRRVPLRHGIAVADFLADVIFVLQHCTNVRHFIFTSEADILSSFLMPLAHLAHLKELRIAARLTDAQMKALASAEEQHLQELMLDYPSWHVLDALPSWTGSMRDTLRTLSLFNADSLNGFVLESTLLHLPHLTGLHLIGSPRLEHSDILRLTGHLPNLFSLAFTIWDVPRTNLEAVPSLPRLRHLALDTRCTSSPGAAAALWEALLLAPTAPAAGSPLSSLVLKPSARAPIPMVFLRALARAFKTTLKRLALLNCAVPIEGLQVLATECVVLGRLETHIPVREPTNLAQALRRSSTLHTLVDLGDPAAEHAAHAVLTRDAVRTIMQGVPRLRTILSDSRLWTGVNGKHIVKLTLEKRSTVPTTHWFLPK